MGNFNDYIKYYRRKLDIPITLGYGCFYLPPNYGWYSHISIDQSDTEAEQIITLFHEATHAEHDQQGCQCMQLNSRILAEYHAMWGMLEKAYATQDKQLIKTAVDLLEYGLKVRQWGYVTAINRTKKLKIYKKCLDFIS